MSYRKDKYTFDYYNNMPQNYNQESWYDTFWGIVIMSILTNIAAQWFWHRSIERPQHKKEYISIKKELKEIKQLQKDKSD